MIGAGAAITGASGQINRLSPVGSIRGNCACARPASEPTLRTSATTTRGSRRFRCQSISANASVPGEFFTRRAGFVAKFVTFLEVTRLRGRASSGGGTWLHSRPARRAQSTSLLKRTAWRDACRQNATLAVDFSQQKRPFVPAVADIWGADKVAGPQSCSLAASSDFRVQRGHHPAPIFGAQYGLAGATSGFPKFLL